MDRLAAMEAFVLVVDTGSFSAAARRLHVGQPSVSKIVAQLEDRPGAKLLTRTTRGLTATEAGLNFYERARRSIEEAEEAECFDLHDSSLFYSSATRRKRQKRRNASTSMTYPCSTAQLYR